MRTIVGAGCFLQGPYRNATTTAIATKLFILVSSNFDVESQAEGAYENEAE
jgi:hypothetical protein